MLATNESRHAEIHGQSIQFGSTVAPRSSCFLSILNQHFFPTTNLCSYTPAPFFSPLQFSR